MTDVTGIGRASAFLASGTIVSRILGFVKAIVLAAAIGVVGSAAADAFAVANGLPNTVYVIVAGGVLQRRAGAADRARERPCRRRQRLHQQARSPSRSSSSRVATILATALAPLLTLRSTARRCDTARPSTLAIAFA